MAIHPSASWSFADLSRELEDRVSRGLVRSTTAPDAPHLTLYVYKKVTEHDKLWDDVTMMARGITLDYRARVVRSRPFTKFFNYGERSREIPSGRATWYDKPDGSLGILFYDGDRWRVTTKGAFASPQCQWAERWLRDSANMSAFVPGDTYLTEIICRADRKVVRYDFEGMILLAAYAENGRGYERHEIEATASSAGLRCVEALHYETFDDLVREVSMLGRDREGCVAHFIDSDYRVKVKGAEYLRVMRIISNTTPLSIWDAMSRGVDVQSIRADVPEEFWGDFDSIVRILSGKLEYIVSATKAEYERLAGKSNQEIVEMAESIPMPAREFILSYRKRGVAMTDDKRMRRSIFQTFRPTNNVLEGYTPSEMLMRMGEDG